MTAILEITRPALDAIVGHLKNIREGSPSEDWVPALIWGERGMKDDGETQWRDLGVGLTLGFYPRGAAPMEAVSTYGDIDIVLINSSPDPNAFAGKKVVLDGGAFMLAD